MKHYTETQLDQIARQLSRSDWDLLDTCYGQATNVSGIIKRYGFDVLRLMVTDGLVWIEDTARVSPTLYGLALLYRYRRTA